MTYSPTMKMTMTMKILSCSPWTLTTPLNGDDRARQSNDPPCPHRKKAVRAATTPESLAPVGIHPPGRLADNGAAARAVAAGGESTHRPSIRRPPRHRRHRHPCSFLVALRNNNDRIGRHVLLRLLLMSTGSRCCFCRARVALGVKGELALEPV